MSDFHEHELSCDTWIVMTIVGPLEIRLCERFAAPIAEQRAAFEQTDSWPRLGKRYSYLPKTCGGERSAHVGDRPVGFVDRSGNSSRPMATTCTRSTVDTNAGSATARTLTRSAESGSSNMESYFDSIQDVNAFLGNFRHWVSQPEHRPSSLFGSDHSIAPRSDRGEPAMFR